jgi:hypothetical protein
MEMMSETKSMVGHNLFHPPAESAMNGPGQDPYATKPLGNQQQSYLMTPGGYNTQPVSVGQPVGNPVYPPMQN